MAVLVRVVNGVMERSIDKGLVKLVLSEKKRDPLERVPRLIISLPWQNLILFQRIYTVEVIIPQRGICHVDYHLPLFQAFFT